MEAVDLSWRAEEACLNAWPSTRTLLTAGWLARASGGPTRRTNSVNPLRSGSFDPSPILCEVRRLYQDLGQPLIFRVPSIADGLDEVLTREEFGKPEAETITLHAQLPGPRSVNSVDLTGSPTRDWLQARAEMNAADAVSSEIYERMLNLVCGPIQFACIRKAGRVAAIAYGVLSRGLLVIESVATRSDMLRQGMAKDVVAALMTWAVDDGVAEACLQVMSDNEPARGLYDGLGFTKELYRYHYRRD